MPGGEEGIHRAGSTVGCNDAILHAHGCFIHQCTDLQRDPFGLFQDQRDCALFALVHAHTAAHAFFVDDVHVGVANLQRAELAELRAGAASDT